MDVKTVRTQLEEVQAELAKLDEQREVFLTLLRGYEAWLRLFDKGEQPAAPNVVPLPQPRPK